MLVVSMEYRKDTSFLGMINETQPLYTGWSMSLEPTDPQL